MLFYSPILQICTWPNDRTQVRERAVRMGVPLRNGKIALGAILKPVPHAAGPVLYSGIPKSNRVAPISRQPLRESNRHKTQIKRAKLLTRIQLTIPFRPGPLSDRVPITMRPSHGQDTFYAAQIFPGQFKLCAYGGLLQMCH